MNTEAIKHYKALTSAIDAASREFLKSFGLSLFSIRRTYIDGSMIWLFNRPSYLEEYCANNIPLPRFCYCDPRHTHEGDEEEGVYFWDEALPVLNISYARERQKVFHGVALYRETKDHCDAMGVGFDHEDIKELAVSMTEFRKSAN